LLVRALSLLPPCRFCLERNALVSVQSCINLQKEAQHDDRAHEHGDDGRCQPSDHTATGAIATYMRSESDSV
jgi:hypothetical protein